MPGYLERTVEFKPGPTDNFADQIHPRIDPALWAMAHVALSAAQSEGGTYAPDQAASIVTPGFYDTAVGAGTTVLNFLTKIPLFTRARGTTSSPHTDRLRTFRGMLIVRPLNPVTDGRRVAEILGPAQREQSVDAIAIRYQQPIDERAGVPLDATAVHMAARLTNVDDDHDQRALVTNVAIPDGTDTHAMLSGQQSLTVTAGNMHDGGLMMPDRGRPSFEYVNRWAQALDILIGQGPS